MPELKITVNKTYSPKNHLSLGLSGLAVRGAQIRRD